MRRLIMVVSVLAAVVCVEAGATYVVATGDNVGIYEREIRKVYEEPIFTVGTSDRLMVVDRGRRNLKVQLSSGEQGWVEKRLVKKVSSRGFVFEHADVMGYLDAPTPMYILGGDGSDEEPIKLDRSFKDALADNVDHETISRQTNK